MELTITEDSDQDHGFSPNTEFDLMDVANPDLMDPPPSVSRQNDRYVYEPLESWIRSPQQLAITWSRSAVRGSGASRP